MRGYTRNAARIVILGITMIMIGLQGNANIADAASNSGTVAVHLPSYRVMLNTYNPIAQMQMYPPIVYKDITYIPMTWNNCQVLNLSVDWNEETGLSISKRAKGTAISMLASDESGEVNNDIHATYQAQIANYPIQVNGNAIDNSKEPYPILSFRDITYFPLTWRFTNDEFQWMTDWNRTEGFTVLTGGVISGIGGIIPTTGDELYVQTDIYGTLKMNKSLEGDIAAVPDLADQSLIHVIQGEIKKDATAGHNLTRIENGRLMFGDIELDRVDASLENNPEDTVVSIGSSQLVSVSLSSRDRDSADVYLVNGTQVERVDQHQPLYRKLANPDGSFWITTANATYDVHHTSWLEQHVWLIDKNRKLVSMNNQLKSKNLHILTVLSDGTLLVSTLDDTGDASLEQTSSDIYRISPDLKVDKMYTSVNGKIYADYTGEVYTISQRANRITKLSNGKSVVLDEITMFQARHGRPQTLHDE